MNVQTVKYTIGLDFGSLSCRGVLADARNGDIVAEASMEYPHGVIEGQLPDGTPLPDGWYLQDPADFEQALVCVIRSLVRESGAAEQIVGIGIDSTASAVLPLDDGFRPLCEKAEYACRPHAWMKMWKHHAAASQAEKLTALCRERKAPYTDWYGGRISPECLAAKVVEIFEGDREVFDAAGAFVEVADYLTSLLAGRPSFSASMASAKAMYHAESGYPDGDFLAAIDPGLRDLPRKLMERYSDRTLAYPGECVGTLCPEMAHKLGLREGIAISAAQMDAYAPMAGLGITKPGVMMMIVGTSTGIMLLSREAKPVEGVTACIKDTYYRGLWGYGSGQACVGDGFQWFSGHFVPEEYTREAKERGMTIQQLLTEKAAALEAGESGLIALDWFNGNKSVLANSRLSGLFLGMTLSTRAEHLYRAMLEATAFGARMVLEAYRGAGVPVEEIRVCGGIPGKNPLLMQIYADVLGLELKVSRSTQAAALGMAVYAAAAAGKETGYVCPSAAAEAMGDRSCVIYKPDAARSAVYEALYQEYVMLHDCFGRGGNRVMERLYEQRNAGR